MAEKNRRVVTLPYGEGLERSKGVMVVQPTTFEDLRNVFLFDGKAQVRRGMAQISVLQDDVPSDLDMALLLEPLRSEASAIGVGYNTTSRELWINRLQIDGTSPLNVGQLGTLGSQATYDPPIIIGADSDNKFFFAHDEPKFASRIVTQFFDPAVSINPVTLQADLDGNGQADVFFRGVVRHLSYIFGWGFGNADVPDRGDVVRVSNSGDSSIFEDFAFFEAGQRGEVVMVCRSAGPSLMVMKETETYEIFGYSPDTFGIRLADSLFGCVGSRLAVAIAGNVFFWSTQGPRLTTGGPSRDIAVPLDVGGPDPVGLVDESDPQDAFAVYDPATRVVNFVWGQRVYALSIRDPNRPRWSYYELGETVQCGGLFFQTESQSGSGGPPTGAPEDLTFPEAPLSGWPNGSTEPGGSSFPFEGDITSLTVDFENIDSNGGETIDVFVSHDNEVLYELVAEVPVNGLQFQTIVIEFESTNVSIQPLQDYKVALRYRQGGFFSPGYESQDPVDWPAASKAGSKTWHAQIVITRRTGDNQGRWEQLSADSIGLTLDVVLPPGHENIEVDVFFQNVRIDRDPDGFFGTQRLDLFSANQAEPNQPTWKAGDPGYPTEIRIVNGPPIGGGIFNGFLALMSVRFSNVNAALGTNKGDFDSKKNTSDPATDDDRAQCFAGPDPPIRNSLGVQPSEVQNEVHTVSWANATTPNHVRSCPPIPPSQHFSEVTSRIPAAGVAFWGFQPGRGIEVGEFITSTSNGFKADFFNQGVDGDEVRFGVRHVVYCFGIRAISEWSIVEANPNYASRPLDK